MAVSSRRYHGSVLSPHLDQAAVSVYLNLLSESFPPPPRSPEYHVVTAPTVFLNDRQFLKQSQMIHQSESGEQPSQAQTGQGFK